MNLKCLLGIHEWNDFTCNKCAKINTQRATSALFSACENCDDLRIHYLLSSGVDPNVINEKGMTPLMIASAKENKQAVALLAPKTTSEEINRRENIAGASALMLAVMVKNSAIASILVEHDADVNLQDTFGKTPLVAATEKNDEETLIILLKKSDLRSKTHAFIEAASRDNIAIMNRLLESGVHVDAFWQGRTAWEWTHGTDSKLFLRERGATCGRNKIEELRMTLAKDAAKKIIMRARLGIYSQQVIDKEIEQLTETYGNAVALAFHVESEKIRILGHS